MYLIQGEVVWNCAVGNKAAFHVIPVWIVGQETHLVETILRYPAEKENQHLCFDKLFRKSDCCKCK